MLAVLDFLIGLLVGLKVVVLHVFVVLGFSVVFSVGFSVLFCFSGPPPPAHLHLPAILVTLMPLISAVFLFPFLSCIIFAVTLFHNIPWARRIVVCVKTVF